MEVWFQGLTEKRPLVTFLNEILDALGARSVCLSRRPRAGNGPVRVLVAGVGAGLHIARAKSRLQAATRQAPRLRPGSVWFASASADDLLAVPSSLPWRSPNAEVAAVVLAVEQDWVDCLEVEFDEPIGRTVQASLIVLGDRLSSTWSQHGACLMSDVLRTAPAEPSASRAALPADQSILCMTNPARLTRAEFRLCVLLSRGVGADGARSELAISRSMLRTHLRSIFAKTHTSSLSELSARLHVPAPGQPAAAASLPARRS